MSEKRYQIKYSGEILEGLNPGSVKKKLQTLLKTDEQGIERFFAGTPIVVKTDVDRETAAKYSQAFEKAGAKCRISLVSDEVKPEVPPSPPKPLSLKEKPVKAPPVPPPMPKVDTAAELLASGEPAAFCPKCGYKQRKAKRCIMCGTEMELMPDDEKSDSPNAIPIAQKPAKPIAPPPIPSVKQKEMPAIQPMKVVVKPGDMILTNLEFIPGANIIEHFGLVSGSTIRAKHIGKDIMAGLKNIFGGELKGYTELLQESRDEAIERMKQQAQQFGANAVVNIRFSTSSIAQGAAELYAYGTAVRIE